MNYERDKKAIQEIMRGAELAVHSKNEFLLSESESKMGWHFFVLHVSPSLMHKIMNLDSDYNIPNMKLEDRFIKWLSRKMEEKQCEVHLDLEWKKGSSKYGLF